MSLHTKHRRLNAATAKHLDMISEVGSEVLRILWCSSIEFKEAIEDCRSLPLISSLTVPLSPQAVEPQPEWLVKNRIRYEGFGTVVVYQVDKWRASDNDTPVPAIVKEFEPLEDVGLAVLKNLQFATYLICKIGRLTPQV